MTPEMDIAVFFIVCGAMLGGVVGLAIGWGRNYLALARAYNRGKADGWIECSIASTPEPEYRPDIAITRQLRRIQ